MELFKIDTLPDKSLIDDSVSNCEEESITPINEKVETEKRDLEEEALEKFIFGSIHSDPVLSSNDSVEPNQKKLKKAAWIDDDDHITAKDGFAHAKKYPKKVVKETDYRSHLVDKFEAIYGRPKWASEDGERIKDGSDDEEDDLFGVAGDIVTKGKRLHKTNLEYSRCASLTTSETIPGLITSVQFHPSSNVALIAGVIGQINLVQVDGDENAKLNSILLENFHLSRARFSIDGREIIIGSKSTQGHFFTYEMISGAVTKVPFFKSNSRLSLKDFALSPDGKYLASCGIKGNFYLFTMNPKENVASFRLNDEVRSVCFSPDSTKLFASGDEGVVYVYDVRQTRRCIHRFIDDGGLSCQYLAISPNSNYFVSGDQSGLLNIYKYEDILSSQNPKPLKSFANLTNPITCLKFNHTSEILAGSSSYADNAIRLAHFPSCTVFSNFPQPNGLYHRINEVDISPNSGYIAMANNRGKAFLYRLNHYADY